MPKHAVIPEGVESVQKCWFQNTGVESVEVAASVREIGADAFSGCKSLRRVTFAAGSQLQTMGDRCFQGSGIEEISVPAGVKVIGRDAFRYCARLKSVAFQEGCALETIKSGCFRCS